MKRESERGKQPLDEARGYSKLCVERRPPLRVAVIALLLAFAVSGCESAPSATRSAVSDMNERDSAATSPQAQSAEDAANRLLVPEASAAEAGKKGMQKPHLTGYVVEKEDRRILVVSPHSSTAADTGINANYEAVWFGNSPTNIEVGMRVQVWAKNGQFEDSYPGQASAERVEPILGLVPYNAVSQEHEAIRKAVENVKLENGDFPIVLNSGYNDSKRIWTIVLLDSEREKAWIKIPDAG